MSYGSQNPWSVNRAAATGADYDLGLRQYMLSVYNYMASGLALTGVVAWLGADSGLYQSLAHTPLLFVIILAPLALVWIPLGPHLHDAAADGAATFWIYAALMGLSLSSIFLVYTGTSIAETFFITAATFPRHEPLRLHHEDQPGEDGLVPDDGPLRHHHREPGQHLHRLVGAAVAHLGHRRAGLHRPDRLGHGQRIKEQYDASYSQGGELVQRTALLGCADALSRLRSTCS